MLSVAYYVENYAGIIDASLTRADEPTQEERPSSGEESNQETMEESSEMQKDPWLRTMTVGNSDVEVTLEQCCAKRTNL